MDDAVRLASWIAHAVGTGDLDGRRGQVMVKAVETFTPSLEKRDLLNRVAELEAQLKRLKRPE